MYMCSTSNAIENGIQGIGKLDNTIGDWVRIWMTSWQHEQKKPARHGLVTSRGTLLIFDDLFVLTGCNPLHFLKRADKSADIIKS